MEDIGTATEGYSPGTVFFIFIVSCFITLAGFGIRSEAGNASMKGSGPAIEWEGRESKLAEPFTGVIGTEEEWRALWGKAFEQEAPRVDFNRYAAACVFLGHYPGWWYSIGMPQPRVSDSTIIVPYELVDLIVEQRADGGNSMREQGSRGQYKMRLIEKKPGFSMRLEMIGAPRVSLKRDFEEKLDKDRFVAPR